MECPGLFTAVAINISLNDGLTLPRENNVSSVL